MQEVDWIVSNPIISDIAVLDPTFNSGPHYLKTLEAFIKGKYRGKLSLQCRAEMITDEFLTLVHALNQTAHVVLELGLQTIHNEELAIIQRPTSITKINKVFSKINQHNIVTEVSLIFGLPNQTVQSFQSSIDFCKQLNVPTIYAYPLMLLRGTSLYENKESLGLVESTDVSANIDRIQTNIPHVISSPSFTSKDWHTMAKMAEALDEYNQSKKQKAQNASTFKMANTLQHTLWKTQKRPTTELIGAAQDNSLK
jgi:radical SAM superfamily enzyme